MQRIVRGGLAWVAAMASLPALAQAFDVGPAPTRNLDPFLDSTLVYQPQSPFLAGVGHWRVAFQAAEANILDVSLAYAGLVPYGLNNRKVMSESFYAWMASQTHENFYPFLDYVQEETTRGTLQVRTGLGPATDVWFQVNGEMHGEGFLDSFTERFHRVTGTRQWARLNVARDQCVFAVASYGQVTFYHQGAIPAKFQDPELGLVHQVLQGPSWGLDGTFEVKAPLSRSYDYYKGGWDVQGGVTGWWKAGGGTLEYGGAYTHRGPGNAAYQSLAMTGNLGAHLGWRGRDRRAFQPYYQLYWQTGFSNLGAQSTLHKSSFQQDLGFHWFVVPRCAFDFGYVGHVAQSGTTEDYQIHMGFTARY
jgi:hypothetical protein